MSPLTISKIGITALAALRSLSDAEFDTVVQVFNSLDFRYRSRNKAVADLSRQLESTLADNANPLAETILELHLVKIANGLSSKLLSDEVIASIEEIGSKRLGEKNISLLSRRLIGLLANESLYRFAKAVNILTDHQTLYTSSRMFTEARPVYSESGQVTALVMYNMLKLVYSENGVSKEIFLALDSKDLDQLGDTVTRAKVKTESLENKFSECGLDFLRREK
jgi:hypothetical protein